MKAPREFDVCGPLPTGVTVLEASAGTGKTHTIATLAARYIAEGVADLDEMLLVTFTRMATGELRERVRQRLVEVHRGLAAHLAGTPAVAEDVVADDVIALLASGDAERACGNLARAIAGFDAATILTTHGFCQEVLSSLGIAGDLEPDVTFAEDLSGLVADVVNDLYIRKYRRDEHPSLSLEEAARIARTAIERFTAHIHEWPAADPEERVRLAHKAREEFELRKRRAAVMSFDDLVARLCAALRGASGERARSLLRSRFRVVLVDEFQDTDPGQWQILRDAFGTEPAPGSALVLIADPKQAIYAFRGADVYAYLEAIASAEDQATLPVNWRSDQGLIGAHDALFGGAQLGHADIVYRRVRAAPGHERTQLTGAPHGEPLRVRVAMREDLELTKGGFAQKGFAQRFVAEDLAGDAARLLASGARVRDEPIAPAHLAVLVRTNAQAELAHDALERAGVPAVVGGAGSVFETDAAVQWLTLLQALERPSSVARAHAAALTDFVGWSAGRLAAARAAEDGLDSDRLHRRLHDWARILRTRGVASLLEAITAGEDMPGRVLAQTDGERRLTDIRHIGQLLHAAASAEQLGPTALATWLRGRGGEQSREEERARRLDSDAQAVQVLTIHRAKGLEFPVVYVPYLWEVPGNPDDAAPVAFHDPGNRDRWTLDVSPHGPDRAAHVRQRLLEERGEQLRLAYVALTRARHQAIVWWAGSWDSRCSPLGRLLFARGDDGVVAPQAASTPDDLTALQRLGELARAAGGAIGVERARPDPDARYVPSTAPVDELSASSFERSLDVRWRRTSYTDLTAASYEAHVGSEPEEPLVEDEPGAEEPAPASALAAAPELSMPALLGEMPVGAEVGTFVHRVMEATDFAVPDLREEVARRIVQVQGRRAAEIGDPSLVADGLAAMISTPLGDVAGGIALRDVTREDRLDELVFELPLAGGDRPEGWVTVDRIADVLRELCAPGDPLRGYAERLADPFLRRTVRGYLTGSLDLVVRLRSGAGEADRFVVLDYKTNWLGEPDEPLTAFHYRPQALLAEMYRHHYALQALLYTVALHRFLRWRVPGYEPDVQLAGVAYLFVRGMTGGSGLDGSVPGVFAWRPPPGLPEALSDVLERGVPER
ncbi:MAG TPA: UvrD-helicase domain-containing protein [Solirubrobacteraceae bacterium]|nr:UvrD-helicase domain-containing protein [Solirubrobacteraceae bacterium]